MAGVALTRSRTLATTLNYKGLGVFTTKPGVFNPEYEFGPRLSNLRSAVSCCPDHEHFVESRTT